jgi:hypothetical protein
LAGAYSLANVIPEAFHSSSHSSPGKGLYNLTASIVHAASLRQGFPHCGRFLAAASRRSLDRVSVPVWPYTLSGRLPIVGLVGRYPANCLMGRRLIPRRSNWSFHLRALPPRPHAVLPRVSTDYPPSRGRSPTCYSPVRHSRFDIATKAAVRLACLKRAASVRSEPGSNSP